MKHGPSSEAQTVTFSRLLAELVNQLRLSYAQNIHEQPSWPVCFRLDVQANLLGGLAHEAGWEELASLAQALSDLAQLGQEDPGHIPLHWSDALNRLAEFLDQMLAGLDAGDSREQWLINSKWDRMTSWFAHLGSPFLVMDEMEEVLLQWQDAWCDGALDPNHEKELKERWQRLRNFGDALFQPSPEQPATNLLQWKGFSP